LIFNNLDEYLNEGINKLVKEAIKKAVKNPKETAFLVQYGLSAKKAEKKRLTAKEQGEHIPSFLIASITEQCNLNCTGCYSRAKKESNRTGEMNREDWKRIFTEAEEMGISAILLAGGEPFLRSDIIDEAALHPSILFPVFTNGTMMDSTRLDIFDKYRHMIPIISIEGDEKLTDERRGEGIHAGTLKVMDKLNETGLLFGVSITVTNNNIDAVTGEKTISDMEKKGCKIVIYVEYVPVTGPEIAPDEAGRQLLEEKIASLREKREMIFISFPGDEKESGGCLAAGRGFFHINAKGDAEPCPFSPYSDTSLKNKSLREALNSPLFAKLRTGGNLQMEHRGGCVLFDQADFVSNLVKTNKGELQI